MAKKKKLLSGRVNAVCTYRLDELETLVVGDSWHSVDFRDDFGMVRLTLRLDSNIEATAHKHFFFSSCPKWILLVSEDGSLFFLCVVLRLRFELYGDNAGDSDDGFG